MERNDGKQLLCHPAHVSIIQQIIAKSKGIDTLVTPPIQQNSASMQQQQQHSRRITASEPIEVITIEDDDDDEDEEDVDHRNDDKNDNDNCNGGDAANNDNNDANNDNNNNNNNNNNNDDDKAASDSSAAPSSTSMQMRLRPRAKSSASLFSPTKPAGAAAAAAPAPKQSRNQSASKRIHIRCDKKLGKKQASSHRSSLTAIEVQMGYRYLRGRENSIIVGPHGPIIDPACYGSTIPELIRKLKFEQQTRIEKLKKRRQDAQNRAAKRSPSNVVTPKYHSIVTKPTIQTAPAVIVKKSNNSFARLEESRKRKIAEKKFPITTTTMTEIIPSVRTSESKIMTLPISSFISGSTSAGSSASGSNLTFTTNTAKTLTIGNTSTACVLPMMQHRNNNNYNNNTPYIISQQQQQQQQIQLQPQLQYQQQQQQQPKLGPKYFILKMPKSGIESSQIQKANLIPVRLNSTSANSATICATNLQNDRRQTTSTIGPPLPPPPLPPPPPPPQRLILKLRKVDSEFSSQTDISDGNTDATVSVPEKSETTTDRPQGLKQQPKPVVVRAKRKQPKCFYYRGGRKKRKKNNETAATKKPTKKEEEETKVKNEEEEGEVTTIANGEAINHHSKDFSHSINNLSSQNVDDLDKSFDDKLRSDEDEQIERDSSPEIIQQSSKLIETLADQVEDNKQQQQQQPDNGDQYERNEAEAELDTSRNQTNELQSRVELPNVVEAEAEAAAESSAAVCDDDQVLNKIEKRNDRTTKSSDTIATIPTPTAPTASIANCDNRQLVINANGTATTVPDDSAYSSSDHSIDSMEAFPAKRKSKRQSVEQAATIRTEVTKQEAKAAEEEEQEPEAEGTVKQTNDLTKSNPEKTSKNDCRIEPSSSASSGPTVITIYPDDDNDNSDGGDGNDNDDDDDDADDLTVQSKLSETDATAESAEEQAVDSNDIFCENKLSPQQMLNSNSNSNDSKLVGSILHEPAVKVENLIDEHQQQQLDEKVVIKRGRGRPRKKVSLKPFVDKKPIEITTMTSATTSTNIIKRGRGRPRKLAPSSADDNVNRTNSITNLILKSDEESTTTTTTTTTTLPQTSSEESISSISNTSPSSSSTSSPSPASSSSIVAVKRGRGRPRKNAI